MKYRFGHNDCVALCQNSIYFMKIKQLVNNNKKYVQTEHSIATPIGEQNTCNLYYSK